MFIDDITKSALKKFCIVNQTRKIKDVLETIHRTSRADFNCWGFTAWLVGWRQSLNWLSESEMKTYLETKTVKISEPVACSIAVFNDRFALSHTAYLFDANAAIHKAGGRDIFVDKPVTQIVKRIPQYGHLQEYRIDTEKFSYNKKNNLWIPNFSK